MTILTRKTQKVFAGNADVSQLAVMGTMKTGTPVYNTDIEVLQGNTAYGEGWDDAILSDKAPYMEEMNGVQYGFSYQIAYLLQEGIPEYDQNTNYSKTSVVKVVQDNDLVLYHSLIDDNQGDADITTSANWAKLYIVNFGRIGEPQITLNDTLPDVNCVWLDGAEKSRTTYANLFAIYGTTYGAGDGSTTFNLPDFRGVAIWGSDSFGYIAAGLPNITATTDSKGAHTHTRGGMNITSSVALYNQDVHVAADTAFYNGSMSSYSGKYALQATSSTHSGTKAFKFDASRQWTGSTSSNGAHTHSVTVNMSTSGILNNSNTVQPPAIKVRVYTRWQ